MGNRYFLEITCPECGRRDTEIYFAPTCGFVDWKCKCGYLLDLVEFTGITPEMASNKAEIQTEINRVIREEAEKAFGGWTGRARNMK